MTAYVLIVLFGGGGFSAEFNDKLSCEEARQTVASTYGKTSAFVNAICLPAGPNGNGKR